MLMHPLAARPVVRGLCWNLPCRHPYNALQQTINSSNSLHLHA